MDWGKSPTCETPRGLTTYALPYSDLPYWLFDHQANGKHTGEQEIQTEAELRVVFDIMIPCAMEQKRKMVIMDQWGQCIFHIEEGILIFPRRDLFQMMVDEGIETLEW